MADNTLILSRDVSNLLATGDIISSVGAGSVVEYMKVLSVENRQIKVERAYFDVTNSLTLVTNGASSLLIVPGNTVDISTRLCVTPMFLLHLLSLIHI